MTDTTGARVQRGRTAALAAREEARLRSETPKSAELFARITKTVPRGVASSYQWRDPYPIYFERGAGSRVWSADGREYSDFHVGYGAMVAGHAHPAILKAIRSRSERGTLLSLPTEDIAIVAEHLTERFKVPKWRFVNSGTEAIMDGIRVARAFTGRDTIVKTLGGYHGHADDVMVAVFRAGASGADFGPRDGYKPSPYTAGVPKRALDTTIVVPFNDAATTERRIEALEAEGRPPACILIEPMMTNAGLILPEPGYHDAMRDIASRHGIVLIIDEVKTGLCSAAGGGTEHFGLQPDMVILAKALGGGLPVAAIGGSDEVMSVVDDGRVPIFGTFNGNPLGMAVARTVLEDVMVPPVYENFDRLNERLVGQCELICKECGLPARFVRLGHKGTVNFTDEAINDYESFYRHSDPQLGDLAWLYFMNRGVVTSPVHTVEWTLSVQSTDEDADRYVDAFREFAYDIAT